ncbi:MAG: TetR/AcrR family transcriptional regulator [Candidatus Eremiobacteraeota bacterium]|nr:TetR/AcrR family transcriptional regulator [Candidatus Eremiobacteraeota bacterium]MBV9408660.1 TetR/AcrR family transcriptional regulator [Candidatus Eremiobacteraeota bacterium]
MNPDEKASRRDGRHARGDRSRALVLEQSMRIASVEGLEGLTLGRLAADVAVSKGNLVTLFGTKESLQIATLDAAVGVFIKRVIAPSEGVVASPLARLRAVNDAFFAYVTSGIFPGGCILYATANEYRAKPGPLRDRALRYYDMWYAYLLDLVQRARDAGEIAADADPSAVTFELMAFQQAANTARLLDRGDEAVARAALLTRARLDALATV